MFKRSLAFLVALSLVCTSVLPIVANEPYPFPDVDVDNEDYIELTDYQQEYYDYLQQLGRPSGLLDFDAVDVDFYSDEKVIVIVELNNRPAAVERALANIDRAPAFGIMGVQPDYEAAAAADRQTFYAGLEDLFGNQTRLRSAPDYEIVFEYNLVINGAAIRLPANRIPDLLEIESVYAVYADTIFYDDSSSYDTQEEQLANLLNRSPLEFSGVPQIHEKGIRGQGILVGVIDSGVDYNHPDIIDAFQSWSSMDDVPNYYKDKVIFNHGRYHYYGWDNYGPISAYPVLALRDRNDPMETTWQEWRLTGAAELSGSNYFYSSHGSHVCGIIAARGVGEPNAVLGVAPEAKLVVYRNGSIYGSFSSSTNFAAMEEAILDKVDIINQSSGTSASNGAYYSTDIAVCYLVLTYGIIYCKSAGNGGPGPSTISAPGSAPVAITVGNSGHQDAVIGLQVGDLSSNTYLRYIDYNSTIVTNPNGTLGITYTDLLPNADYSYNFYVLPFRANSGASSSDGFNGISSGAIGAWTPEAIAAAKGKIVIIARGHTFLDQVKNAKDNGAGGVLMVNSNGGTGVDTFSGIAAEYLPYIAINYQEGMNLITALQANEMQGSLTSYTPGNKLSGSSSRGPILGNYEIKPDLFAPGSGIMSTVPVYDNWPAGLSYPLDVDYVKDGYGNKSGTSMASPHMAGLVALLLSEDVRVNGRDADGKTKMKYDEVRARFINTADMLSMAPDAYSVHDIGTGRANLAAAMAATSYVTVLKDDVPVVTGNLGTTGYRLVSAPVSTLSFGFANAGYAYNKELTATIYNTAASAKTFDIAVQWNTTGQGVAYSPAVQLNVPSTISVAAAYGANKAYTDFTTEIVVPASLTDANKGSHQGYLLLTNRDDSNESYKLAFAVEILGAIPAPSNYFRYIFFNKNVASSNAATRQNDYVLRAEMRSNVENVFTNPNDTGANANRLMAVSFPYYKADNPGLSLGTARADYNASSRTVQTATTNTTTTGGLQPTNAIMSAARIPGHYIIEATAKDRLGATLEVIPLDFYIDNEAPEVTITAKDATNKLITGSIRDEGMEEMAAKNINYPYLNRKPDYRDLAIVAVVENNKYARGTIAADGSFSIDLSRLFNCSDGTSVNTSVDISDGTPVKLYAFDHFTERHNGDVTTTTATAGFDITRFSFLRVSGTNYYAFTGVNMLVLDIVMGGAVIIVTEELPDAIIGEPYTMQLEATGDEPILWSISEGTLPEGLTLDTDTGEISGVPEEHGVFSLTITAANGLIPMATKEYLLNVLRYYTVTFNGFKDAQYEQTVLSGKTVDWDDLPEIDYWNIDQRDEFIGWLIEESGDLLFELETIVTQDYSLVAFVQPKPADFTLLREAVDLAWELDEGIYTEESWAALAVVLIEAEELMLNPEVNAWWQETIDDLTTRVYEAMADLVEIPWDVTVSAKVTKQTGNTNLLTITITEFYINDRTAVISKTFEIKNNAADIYTVADYSVYVDTKGNDQIRDCFIVN